MKGGEFSSMDDRHGNNASAFLGGFIGAVAGAFALAGTIALLFADKDKRQKAEDKLDDMKKWTDKTVTNLKTKADEVTEKTKQRVLDTGDKAKGKIGEAQEEVEKRT